MKATFAAIIATLRLVMSYRSDWRFTIINKSPFNFLVSNAFEQDISERIPPALRPLTQQIFGIRFDAKDNLQIEYGNRLKLYFALGPDRVAELVDIVHDPSITYSYDPQLRTLVIGANPNIDKFSFIVSSDPQPFRLDNNGDPNAQRSLWLETTKPVFNRIAKEETDAHIVIVNGDLTEFGRTTQWKTFLKAISAIRTPMVCGLGNHDYENNVGDCTDLDPTNSNGKNSMAVDPPTDDPYSDWFPSSQSELMGTSLEKFLDEIKQYVFPGYFDRLKNLCARRMVQRMRDHESYLIKLLPSFSWDEESLAYAWNYGTLLRFAQLHNRLNYEVSLRGFLTSTVVVKSSLDWLIADMNEHKDRTYILNVHDAMSHPDLEKLKPYFGRIKAIFGGHTHEAGVKCFKGIRIFDSGALFKNEFLRVNFSENGRCFDVLHFLKDGYVSPLATDYCFQSILENPC